MTLQDGSAVVDPRSRVMERIIEDRIRSAHILRCALQGHHGNPCQFCGVKVEG